MQKMLTRIAAVTCFLLLLGGCQKKRGPVSNQEAIMENANNEAYMLEYSKRAREQRRKTIDLKEVFEKDKEYLLRRYGSYENYLKTVDKFYQKQEEKYQKRKGELNGGAPVSTTTENGDRLYVCWYTEFETKEKYRLLLNKYAYILDCFDMLGFDYNHECDRAGTSPVCVAQKKAGYIDDSDQSALSDCERNMGYFLPCVTYAESDIEMLGGCHEAFLQMSFIFCFGRNGG